MPERRDWVAEVSACAVHRWVVCVQPPGLAPEEECPAVAAGHTRAVRAVADTREEVADTGLVVAGLEEGTDLVAAVAAVVGCEAVAGRRRLLEC